MFEEKKRNSNNYTQLSLLNFSNKKGSVKKWFIAGAVGFFLYSVFFIILTIYLAKFGAIHYLISLLPETELKGVNVLVFGTDDNREVKRADSIVVFHLDASRSRIGVLSIPRDTRVKYAQDEYTKINHTYAFGGVQLLRETVSDFLGVPIDHYVQINLNGITQSVDMLGGVEIVVEKDLVYTDQAAGLYIHIEKGRQVLDGEKAMHYLRFRHDGEGDIGRIRRQQLFMSEVADKLLSPKGLFELPSLIAAFNEVVSTDLSVTQMIALGSQFKKAFSEKKIDKGTVPGAISLIKGSSYWRPDVSMLDKIVTETLLGFGEDDIIVNEAMRVETVDEESSKDIRRTVTPEEVRRVTSQSDLLPEEVHEGVKVEVLNGFGIKGMARDAAAYLKENGINVARVDNAGSFNYENTLIVDWKGNIEKVLVLAQLLKIDPKHIIVYDRPSKPLDATLVLGKDWVTVIEKLKESKSE